MQGTVKWYNEIKGYGFIQTSDNKDIFVHRSGLENSYLGLETGQTVQFDVKDIVRHRLVRKIVNAYDKYYFEQAAKKEDAEKANNKENHE